MGFLDAFSLASLLSRAEETPRPKTVLVPPMFERDIKARSRMVKSSYDYLFAKPALRWLMGDYFQSGLNTALLFAPSLDQNVSVKAKIGTDGPGSMSIRYQPYGMSEPLCFLDIKASPKSPGDVTLRACAFSTDTGLGSFATLPLAKEVSGKRAEVGVRYSSPQLTAGAVLQPATNKLAHMWLCGRRQGLTVGLQVAPGLAMHDLQGSLQAALGSSGAGGDVAAWLRGVSSLALSYSPEARTRAGQHSFTAAMEMQEGRAFVISFFQHMAAVRQVFNPLEKDDVIGITNYIDVGLQLHVPLTADAAASSASAGGKPSWFQPSVALACVLDHSFATRQTRTGVTVQVENFGRLRYERSRDALAHGRILTQRHEATNAEVAMSEGDRPLVGQQAADGEFNQPEPASTTYL